MTNTLNRRRQCVPEVVGENACDAIDFARLPVRTSLPGPVGNNGDAEKPARIRGCTARWTKTADPAWPIPRA